MEPRRLLATLVTAALLASGCLAPLGDELGQASSEELPQPRRHELQLGFDPAPGPTNRAQIDEEMPVASPVAGLAVSYELTIEAPGEVQAWLQTPDEERIELVSERATQAGERSGHLLVPPAAGTWSVHVDASAPGSLGLEAVVQPTAPSLPTVATEGPTRPVVAVVDTGINPYHEVFQREQLATADLPDRIDPPLSLPIDPQPSYGGSLATDAALWAQVPDERLVHFAGTNVLGYELGDTELPQAPVLDRAGHGTSVAHAVVDEAPDAIVVMVTGPDYDAGVQWAAEQAWIDLISLSWGPVVNAAGVAEPHAGGFTTPEVTKAAHRAGQQVFAASGNDPTVTVTDTTTGPPWVHAVSGAQPETNARAGMSGNLIDTVANWTQTLADHESRNETRTGSGTSFATPRTAGIAAHVLGQVRDQVGHDAGLQDGKLVATDELTVTNAELRDALNRSAVYWNTTDYGGPGDPGPSVPVAPTPWVSMGWGYLDGSRASIAVDALLSGELPDKPAQAEAGMQAHQDSREAYWQTR